MYLMNVYDLCITIKRKQSTIRVPQAESIGEILNYFQLVSIYQQQFHFVLFHLAMENKDNKNNEQIICFICKETISIENVDNFESEMNTFVNHLIFVHKVLIPKFKNWDDFSHYYSSIESLHKAQYNDRCSPLILTRCVLTSRKYNHKFTINFK